MSSQPIEFSSSHTTSQKNRSTPSLFSFNPFDVAYQARVLRDIEYVYDYTLGSHEILLSGSVGSAKSVLMAHYAVKHCIKFPGARFLLGRRSMPDLKSTIYKKTCEHIEGDLIEGVDFSRNMVTPYIRFRNGSEIITKSWADKHYYKMRSLELSGAAIEELSENDEDDKEAYLEIVSRVGRIPHVKENVIISATNPDSPSHWAYKHFMLSEDPTRKVYYSLTSDNRFLPPQYIQKLLQTYDPKMIERMIYGKWIDIKGETIYYQYDRDKHFKDYAYQVNKSYPLRLFYDFNIGDGKPMSCAVGQYINDHFHFFDESVIYSGNTLQTITDIEARGLLDKNQPIIIHGDAAGNSRDTRSHTTDYEILESFLKRTGYRVTREVASANPPIRNRHNIVNGYLENSEKQIRISIYKYAKTVDEGLRMVKLKPGGSYIEDEKYFQHITTAIGYGIVFIHNSKDRINKQINF